MTSESREPITVLDNTCYMDICIKHKGRVVGIIETKSLRRHIEQRDISKPNPIISLGQLSEYMVACFETNGCRESVSGFLTNMRQCIILELSNSDQINFPKNKSYRKWTYYHFNQGTSFAQTEQMFFRFMDKLVKKHDMIDLNY